MSTILRTARNLWRIGFKVRPPPFHVVNANTNHIHIKQEYGHQMQYIGDTKAGTLIAMDRYGNKYYENMEELPLRTRWVDYKEKEFDASQIYVGWHAWLAYMVDKPPTQDAILQASVRSWELLEHQPTMTLSRGAYKPYSTVRPKYSAWKPVAAHR
ncbi:hypothetical protein ACJ73_05210 [Blastomyces percursus]|uniref:NADH dehydrogenase [ubiquinone] 1 alpha subcomplex subunit n=1 Tax=Blastomyces percursus TaxID=1658174 RepID=A0A1J9QT79_9EURO|nr:hypothetical protein ACJ73_05210 [Blastomyces percursus]